MKESQSSRSRPANQAGMNYSPAHFLLIHQAFVLPGEPGGTRHFELIKGCLKKGHRFTVVASSVSYLTGSEVGAPRATPVGESGRLHLIRVSPLSGLHRSFLRRVASFISFMFLSLRAAWKVPRVAAVIGTSPPLFQAVSAWLSAIRLRCPFILEIRDLWPEFAIDMGVLRNPLLIFAARRLERFLYGRATEIIVNSPAYRDYLVDLGVKQKISVIPNGVDTSMFNADAERPELRRQLGLEGQFVITYCGALGLANDIGTILEAAALLRDRQDIHFLLVGSGKEEARLRNRARELELPNVGFAGARPKSEVPGILAASDAGVATLQDIPMFRTTYPNKVFDYMAAGRPTLLAIDGVIRKVVEDAQAGLFVPPGDPTALARAVEYLADNPKEAESMGRSARQYVITHFDRSLQAAAFEELLRSVVNEAKTLPENHKATA